MKEIDTLILDSILKHSNIIMFTLDKDYNYITFSQKYCEIIKNLLQIDIKIGDCMLDSIIDDSDKKRAKYNFDKVLQGDSFILSEEFIDKKLISTHWENHYTPVYKDENIIGINIIIYDLTYQVNISRKFDGIKIFEKIINFIDVGIAIADPYQDDMPIIYINNSFSQITGYEKDEVIGRNGSFLHKNDLEQDELKILEEAIENKSNCEVIMRNYKKDGTLFFALLNITPIFNIDGTIAYLVGILIDITNTMKIKKLETIKKLSAGLTHELNTALTTINGNIEMLKYDIDDLDDKNIKNNMNDSLENINKSKNIISNITTSLHYLNDLTSDKKEKTDLVETIQEALDNFKDKIKQQNIKINININNNDKVYYNCENKALVHLWIILIDNSIDSVVFNEDLKNIDIDIQNNTKDIIISIIDNGKGIAKNIKDDIFQPLTKEKSFGGMGMGLFNAKNIVEANNGIISFESDEIQTKFSIIFNKMID